MTYRVEYNGSDLEIMTLDAALDGAKQAVVDDVGPVGGFAVEHDEAINTWFVQGVRDGTPVGATAVVTGPEEAAATGTDPGLPSAYPPAPQTGGWVRTVTFAGVAPAEVFGKATTWLAARPDAVVVRDLDWRIDTGGGEPFQLVVHYLT